VLDEGDYPERMVVSPASDIMTADPEQDGPDATL
jgi:hypothetical protein